MRLNNYPTVTIDSKKKVFVSFYINNKRYRLYNSNRIGDNFNPNSFPEERRIERRGYADYLSLLFIKTCKKVSQMLHHFLYDNIVLNFQDI